MRPGSTQQPVVANPYLNATTGTVADTGEGRAVQPFAPAAILVATALAAANPHLIVTTGTAAVTGGGEAAQRARGHLLPRRCTDAELRAEDPRIQAFMATPSIRMMAPTLTAGLALLKTQNGSSSTSGLLPAACRFMTSPMGAGHIGFWRR